MIYKRVFFVCLVLSLVQANAQENGAIANALKFAPDNLAKYTPTLSVIPQFSKNGTGFKYYVEAQKRKDYYYVDLVKKKQYLLNDTLVVLNLMADLLGNEINKKGVLFESVLGKNDEQMILYLNKHYAYDPSKKSIKEVTTDSIKMIVPGISPDQKWKLFCIGHNLYLNELGSKNTIRLSNDGEVYYSFGINVTNVVDSNRTQETVATWVPNSHYFYAVRTDSRKVESLTVINSLTQKRPLVTSYKYALPGDKDIEQYALYVGKVGQDTLSRIAIEKWKDQSIKIISSDDSTHLYFTRFNRMYNEVELCRLDLQTLKMKVLIQEKSLPFIDIDLFAVHIINHGKNILWWSDRTGWGQWYHYNSEGVLVNSITKGNWTAGKILQIDTLKSTIYFNGYGKENTTTPYYTQFFSARIDGRKMINLTPENADHKISIAPKGEFILDTYSRIDSAPRSIVKDFSGKKLMDLYSPDLQPLYNYGWKKPELFTVRAADDSTILYGIMWKPFDFDSSKKYPIISQVYPGPQIETVWSDFTVFDRYNNTSLAQMGFIVVCMGHRGGSPYRSTKYYKYGFGDLRDYAIADDKYGIEQLARRFSYIDSTKVGISGHSGGGMMAFAALGLYPQFYKAAVSSSGNHDNRLYNRFWGETYQGLEEKDGKYNFDVKTSQALAKNITGKLLLVTGEYDQNVNPAGTMRLENALILADKKFDFLILPGQTHHYEDAYKRYFQRRQWEFFYDAFLK